MNRNKKRAVVEKNAEGAKRAAISFLAYREHTGKELYTKLVDRGFSREDAAGAVAFVTEKDYLSERRYYVRFVEFCAKNKLYGRRRIGQEARRKGFSEETIVLYTDEALLGIDFDDRCFEALKKVHHTERDKQTAYLLRKGFSVSNIRYAFERYKEEIGPLWENEEGDLETDLDDFK